MMYVEPTSQYKFVAKPSPTVEETPAVAVDGTATSNTTTTAETVQPQTNTATHFQAAEHVQNKTLNRQSSGNAALGLTYDGKRMRKAVQRRTVDYNSSVIRLLESRKWFKSSRNQYAIQPQEIYNHDVVPPAGYIKNPMNAVTTKFVRTSTNKLRCPIFCVVWTPEGRRLVTGASSGEFTLWNGLTFNFETILQAHDRAVRSMVWSHHDAWLLTGDHGGFVKYWQSNMNNVKMYEAHKDPIRGLSFSPSDNKFASCSDDGLVKVWDFFRCAEERQLKGHGADVKCVDWHPSKGLLVSGSKDSQQPVKLWDPKSGNSITTLHAHKSTVMTAKWNDNGNWLLTGSRDHLLKVFDIRVMKELQTFRGHKKEATAVSWHPVHETLFASGGSDGSIMFWLTGVDEKAGAMDKAHEGIVWSLAWHPLGHILCSGSNDHTSKFWTRNRPGDTMHDRYNLDISQQDDGEYNEEGTSSSALPGLAALDTNAIIPGVGLPVTASNVVLPDSKDPNDEKHLYGDAGKGRAISLPRTQATTTSSSNAVPRSSLPNASFNRANRHIAAGQQPSGGATTPGIDLPRQIAPGVPRGPEIEANRDLNKSLNPSRGLPPGPRPDLRPARPDAGPPRPGFDRNQTQSGPQFRPPFSQPSNRPQFFGAPRPGVEFRPRVRPGGQDPNFRPSGPFPPNEFMRFPGPSGSHRPGPNFGPPINEQPRDPRPPGFQPPGPDVRAPGQSVSEQEMLGDRKDVRGQSQDQKPVGPRDMFGRSNESPRASPPVLPSTHGRPERRDSDPTAHGMRGDYHARELEQQRHRNRDQIPGDNQKLPDQGPSRHGPPDQGRRGQGLPDQGHPGQGPDGPGQPLFARQNPNPRGGPSFEPPFDKAFPDHAHGRPDIGRPDQPPHERPNIGRPGERQFHNQPDMRRHGDWGPHAGPPHERPDMGRPGDRPHHDRRDIGRPGDRPPQDIGRPGDRPLQDMGRPGGRPPQDMGRPGGRPPQDMGRPGGRPPQDMGRIGDRPPQDMGRPGDRPPQDIGRPVDRPPQDMGRPGGRPPQDMGRPGDRPPQDIGRPGDRPPQDMGRPGGRPPQDMGRPGDRPPQDMGRPGDRPPHGMGRPGDRSPYERSTIGGPGGPSLHERPGIPDLGHSRDRPPHSRPDMGRPGDHPHDRPNMGHPVDQQDRLGVGRPGERPSHDTSDLGRPEQRLPHDRPDMNRPGDRPSFNRPDMARHGEPPPNNRPDLVRPGDRPRFNRPDLVRSGERPPHDRPEMGQPGNRPPFDRPERGHPGDRPPFNRPDMGRPGERPPHDRPDMGRPTDRPPHDRPDMGRPADRPPFDRPDMRRPGNRSPHDRPDMGRPGDRPSHDRPDLIRPGNRSPHDRPDVGRPGDRSPRDRPDMGRPGDSREAPREPLLHERPGLLGTPPRGDKGRPDPTFHNRPDMGHDRAGGPPPRPGMGPPSDKPNDVFKFPRDPQNFASSINERPRQDSASKPNFGGRDRASPGRLEANHDTANQSERRDGMGKPGEQGTIKPLMSLMAARPGGGHHPPGGLGNQPGHTGIETEKRGRKRSTEHEYDRAPKRKETGENRDRAW